MIKHLLRVTAAVFIFSLLAFPASVTASTNYDRGNEGSGGQFNTVGFAPRSFNEIYHYAASTWYLSYCNAETNGLPISCGSSANATGVNPFIDGRSCTYCIAVGFNATDNYYVRWDLLTS